MANLKNWLPEMNADERAWFDGCPKSVLFEIARQFALRLDYNEDADQAFAEMRKEWDALHANGIVPQKPFSVEKARAKSEAYKAQMAALKAT